MISNSEIDLFLKKADKHFNQINYKKTKELE
jgi:hypothetical protein